MKGTDVVAGSNFDGCWRVREREREEGRKGERQREIIATGGHNL